MHAHGLVCIVLSALLACVLALPAGAPGTALCEDAPSAGVCKVPYESGKVLRAKSTNSVIETSLGNLTCTESEAVGHPTEEATAGGKTLKGLLTALSFAGCKLGATACTVSAVHLSYKNLVSWTEGSKATFKVENGGAGAPGASAKCGALLSCTFIGEMTLDVNGGSAGSATLVASKETLAKEGGAFCPATVTWSATYTFTEPEGGNIFAANNAVVTNLCEVNETPCEPSHVFPAGVFRTQSEAGSPNTFSLQVGGLEKLVTCTAVILEGQTSSKGSWPLRGKLDTLALGSCTSKPEACTVTALHLRYYVEMDATGGGDGELSARIYESGPPGFSITCTNFKCTYQLESLGAFKGTISGGEPARLTIGASFNKFVKAESGPGCGSEATWSASETFVKPLPNKMWIVREGA